MKILMVSGEYYGDGSGGIGKHVLDLSKELSKRGHEIHIVTKKGSNLTNSGIFIHSISCSKIPIYRLIEWSFKVKNRFKNDHYDVIHAHMPTAMIYPLIHDRRIPLVLTYHSSGAVESNNFLKFLERKKDILCAKNAKAVIAVSKTTKAFLDKSIKNTIYVPNGVRLVNSKKKFNLRKIRILYAGRLEKIKGIETFVEAMAKLDGSKFHAYVAGSGRLEKKLKESASKNVTFTGFIADKELSRQFKLADIFVLPSLSESMPISLLEAMSYGLPCITTDIGSVKAIVSSKFSLQFKPNDSNGLAEAIMIMSHKKKLESFSAHAKQYAKHYDLEDMAKKVAEIYDYAASKG